MPQLYYMVLTSVGAAKKANKEAQGQSLQLTELAVGDGDGAYVAPDQNWTTLTNEVDRVAINQIYQDPNNLTYLVVEAVIPQDIPVGYYIREVGIFDIDGDMIMVGAYPQTYKPTLAEGAARDLYIRAISEIGNTDSVALNIDPSVVLSTRKYVDDSISGFSGKNKIINPLFHINQREVAGEVVLAAGEYGHDRFKAGAAGCTYTFSTSGGVTTITISAGSLQQVIDGNNLLTGTHTLSWEGTAKGKIDAGDYSDSGVNGEAVSGTNMTIEFNAGTLTKIQLEKNNFVSAFEHRNVNDEFKLCKQYFFKMLRTTLMTSGQPQGFTCSVANSSTAYGFLPFGPMRAIPSISLLNIDLQYAANGGDTITSIGAKNAWGGVQFNVGAATLSAGQVMHANFTGDTSYIEFDAEL